MIAKNPPTAPICVSRTLLKGEIPSRIVICRPCQHRRQAAGSLLADSHPTPTEAALQEAADHCLDAREESSWS
jgi:hypothetical protein